MRRAVPALAAGAALVLVSVLAALLLGEVVLRVLGVTYPVYVWTDPVRGVAHIPGARSAKQFEGRSWVEINSAGLRGPEATPTPRPGTFRIALLGDSFIEAFEVPYEHTVGELIERQLADLRQGSVEVLNFGVGGYGTAQELLTLRHEVWKYHPDLVLLAVTAGNDVSDNYRPLKRADNVPYFVLGDSGLVLDSSFLQAPGYRSRAVWTRRMLGLVQHSRVAQLVNRVRHTWRKHNRKRANAEALAGDEVGLRDEVQLPPATPEWQEAWRVTEALLRAMRDECRSRGTPFAVVTLSRGIQVTPRPEEKAEFLRQLGADDLFYPERRLKAFGAREGIPVLNLAPAMAAEAEARKVFFHADRDSLGIGHWNEAGHRAAAALIASWLADSLAVVPSGPSRAARRPRPEMP